MTSLCRYGSVIAGILLIAFGVGSVVVGYNGRDQVRSDLAREQIVGTPDSTVPGQKVDTGTEAQAFAKVGFALLLVGVGFLVPTLMALRRPATSTELAGRDLHGARWTGSRAAYPSAG
jgi:hypothetical protein